jgi:repressor LexA
MRGGDDLNKFSEIIKELREKQGITQEQLAEYLDVSRGTVGMWETGKRRPSQELYEKIADMFNVDMDYLYGRTNIKKARHYDEQGNEYVASYYLNEETNRSRASFTKLLKTSLTLTAPALLMSCMILL